MCKFALLSNLCFPFLVAVEECQIIDILTNSDP